MAEVDLMGGDVTGFDFDEEFRRRVPTGGATGGTQFDLHSPDFSNPTPQPAPQPGNMPGFDYGKLDAWRKEGQRTGVRVDETDLNVFNDPDFRAWQQGSGMPSRLVADQFDDPYTNQLEGIAKAQMGEVRNNPGLNQLTQFLNQQFGELSQTPGFSPDEMALLRTQVSEPIEDLRAQSQKRAMQRASARGFLPTSGITQLTEGPGGNLETFDTGYDRMRTQANRDLSINAIDRRDSDLNRAGQIATQLGIQIPGQQRGEELALASLLYDLPRKALQDALAVTQGSPTSNDLFSQTTRVAEQNRQNQYANQQKWAQLAQLIAGFDF